MKLILDDDEIKRVVRIIVDSIKSKVQEIGAKGGIVALSGGIDSSLVAKLSSMALEDKVTGLIMPEVGVSDPKDIRDAEELARFLGIEYRIIEINDILKPLHRAYIDALKGRENKIAWANVKPRVRMILNYVYANLEEKIVIGTGNKTELLLGYFTKYGDAGVDILPIGNLYKTQVRQVARYLKLPKEIVDKVPSAGLWPGQTDEAEIGASYEEIDNILYLLIEKGYTQKETAAKLNVDLELVKDLYERMKRNEHKRKTPAVTKLQAIP